MEHSLVNRSKNNKEKEECNNYNIVIVIIMIIIQVRIGSLLAINVVLSCDINSIIAG